MPSTSLAAQRMLARLWSDIRRAGGPLNSDEGEVSRGDALAAGSWGVVLAFDELARALPRWEPVRGEVAALACHASGRGLFTGPEGQAAATGSSSCVAEAPGRHLTGGDLMMGSLGEGWSRLCLGEHNPDFGARPRVRPGDPGLAHGRLGVAAWQLPEVDVDELRAAEGVLVSPGWCNGRAGLAALALIAFRLRRDVDALDLAIDTIGQAIDECVATDGLCHGALGTLAVAAGAARIGRDKELAKAVLEKTQALCENAQVNGWRLEEGRTLDHGWLTGVAGIAWGLLVVTRQPRVNPLSPADSVVWSGGD